MSAPTTIAIAGITSKLALKTATHLLKQPHITIHGLARTPSKLPADITDHPRVKLFTVGASEADVPAIQSALKGTSTVICFYLGDNSLMVEGQKRLIDASIAEGVSRYFASDYSLDYRQLEFGQIPPKDAMKHVHAYLQERQDKIRGVHVLNGMFMELFYGHAGYFSNKKGAITLRYYGNGDQPIEVTTYDDTAKMIAAAAADESATGVLTTLGDRKSVKEVAKVFKEVHDVDVQLQKVGDLEELGVSYKEALRETPQNIWSWMQGAYNYNMLSGYGFLPQPLSQEKYGLTPMGHKEYIGGPGKEQVGTVAN